MTHEAHQPAQRVMVLYTGGTIGMQASANGLAPASGFEARMAGQLAELPELVVPQWRFREMSPLIDSANMTPAYWLRLREAVIEAVDVQGCDAVLVLHGTDTLAYSAAALGFQLLGLDAPVVFTGSMLPAGVPDSDAWENVNGALLALGNGLASGVHLYFHGELMDPTRCAKIRSFGRNPFAPLQRSRGGHAAVSLPDALDYRQPRTMASVAVLPLFPGIGAAQLNGLIDSGIQGLVLECFGNGTGPSDDPQFIASLEDARARGICVIAITQCHEGGVELDVYEAGSRLRGAGVLSGGGMTREAALGKLHTLLGADLTTEEVRRLVELDLCGELR
ncbi:MULTISPECIES: asparaginase [Pseudomonas syringae group]|uniref:asparaginase n=1 Tax=Pseudomonas syringae group TaxID=136849 RepID=UPI00073128CC|nr:asparaginase [Pseudomonas viridiflava]KTC17877.1 asparaginase [Pseudomonas marginalis ICMP 11289]MCF8978646.1 asparaginase [Pseudomonas syringae]VVN22382.1 L-asparaginase 1 [Pseudomonas fluorescens]MBV1813787.1 asparaginase [Pseudomonas viridiflava]MCI3912694.1 asparaginase [Pseudomonas viridiflava]